MESEFDFLGGCACARPYTHEPDKQYEIRSEHISVEYSTNGLQRVDAQTSNWNWFRDRFKIRRGTPKNDEKLTALFDV